MIKKLRLKLILVIAGALLLIFGAVLTTLNLAVYNNSVQQTESFISMIAENDGFLTPQRDHQREDPEIANNDEPPHFFGRRGTITADDVRARRYFYVKTDLSNNILSADYSMMFDFPESEAQEYISKALSAGNASGQIGYFYYGVMEKSYGKIVVFAERRVEMDILSGLTSISLVVAGISCVLLLLLSFFLSDWMVAPIKKAFEKQRQFISDANHELKTPLTIISANVDVLHREVGENERFGHIRTQLTRMNKLIGHLLTLSKTENSEERIIYTRFNLSNALLATSLEFESRAYEEGRVYDYDIHRDITGFGDEEKLKSLLSILIDNAIKHSEKGSEIKVSLKTESGKPRLSVYNTGLGLPDSEKEKIFDRFYRSDHSRARETGGYGLGLSIAKAIVEAHKGKIKVTGQYGKWVEFIVTLT
jgi:nitrogen-specific signal transduction histidine kinase